MMHALICGLFDACINPIGMRILYVQRIFFDFRLF